MGKAKEVRALVAAITPHSFRHVLSTVADKSDYVPSEKLNIGLWAASALAQDEQRRLSRAMAMPMLYSAEQGSSQALGKLELLFAFRRAILGFFKQSVGTVTPEDLMQAWAAASVAWPNQRMAT